MGIGCGCFGKTSHEMLVDEMFSLIPLRNLTLDEVIQIIDQNSVQAEKTYRFIPDTSFQKIFNQYGVYEDKRDIFHNYWNKVLTYFPRKKTLYMVILLCLLSNFIVDKETVIKFLELFNKYFETTSKGLVIIGTELHDILSKYIISISYLSIEPFEKLASDKNEFTYFLRKHWAVEKIWKFVSKTYFANNRNMKLPLDIKDFLTKNLETLKDDVKLRKKLTNFIIKNEDIY